MAAGSQHECKNDPTTMIEVKVDDVHEALPYLKNVAEHLTPEGLGKLIEGVGIDHDATLALVLIQYCLVKGLNLSYCWDDIRHYIHDVLRRGNKEWERETVYTYTIQQLCDSVALYVRCIYDNDNYPEFSSP